jgi:hypothetical protein
MIEPPLVPPHQEIHEVHNAADNGDYARALHLLADLVQSIVLDRARPGRL